MAEATILKFDVERLHRMLDDRKMLYKPNGLSHIDIYANGVVWSVMQRTTGKLHVECRTPLSAEEALMVMTGKGIE